MKRLISCFFLITLSLSLFAEDKPFPEKGNNAVEYAVEYTVERIAEDSEKSRRFGANLSFFGLTIIEAGTRVFNHDAFSGSEFSSLGVIIAGYGCYIAFKGDR